MVGIFDSGVGGLTALRALRRFCPGCDISYFADTAHVPYGSRSERTICRYAAAGLSTLSSLSPEAVLVACGTVSTVFLPRNGNRYPFPVCGIVEAGTAAALAAAPHGKIAVLGTEATVLNGAFCRSLEEHRRDVSVVSLSCPLFVTLAECGMTDPDDPLPRLVAERTLSPLYDFDPEVILLGCTHFPWLLRVIAPLFPHAFVIDCGAEAAKNLSLRLSEPGGCGRTCFYVTDNAPSFRRRAENLLGPLSGAEFFEIPPNDF